MDRDASLDAQYRLAVREAELARVQKIGQIGGLTVDLRGGQFRNTRSPEYLVVHGLPPEAVHETHEDWVRRIHPDDRERVLRHFLATVGSRSTDYEVEYRIIRPSDGQTRWILAKAEIERDESGAPILLQGAHIDVTARKQAEEQYELVARELSHRIANIFAVVSSIIRMAARAEPENRAFAAKLEERLAALHRAHAFVGRSRTDAEGGVIDLLSRLLAPYREGPAERIRIEGQDGPIGPQAATCIALIVHELATNAVKYGALSSQTGTVTVSVHCDERAGRVEWRETGGPAIEAQPTRSGFGSTMIERTVKAHKGLAVHYEWEPAGLFVTIDASTDALSR
jgi:PAS domain S-box-containing protein